MKPQLLNPGLRTILLALLAAALSCAVLAWPQNPAPPASSSVPEGKAFPTPQAAADALIKAADSDDVPALLEILGPDGKDLVASTDAVHDKTIAKQFAEKAQENHAVSVEKNTAILQVGRDNWPMPIPIVKREGKWYFDTKQGREE